MTFKISHDLNMFLGDRISLLVTNNSLWSHIKTDEKYPASLVVSIHKSSNRRNLKPVNLVTIYFNQTENVIINYWSSINHYVLFKTLNTNCAWWDMNEKIWSSQGCSLVKRYLNGLVRCECNHTTYFALIAVILTFVVKLN